MKSSGVLLLFFDFPMKTEQNRKNYRGFIKNIKNLGFIRLQESVYVRLQRSTRSTKGDISNVRKYAPSDGDVMILPLTVGDFAKLVCVAGDGFDVHLLCDDFIVIE